MSLVEKLKKRGFKQHLLENLTRKQMEDLIIFPDYNLVSVQQLLDLSNKRGLNTNQNKKDIIVILQKDDLGKIFNHYTESDLEDHTIKDLIDLLENQGLPISNLKLKNEYINRIIQAQKLFIESIY